MLQAPSVVAGGRQFDLDRYAPWILLLGSAAYYSCYFNYQVDLDDEGLLLWGATDIARGWFPVSDYAAYMPLSYFGLSALFHWFGDYVLVERVYLMAFLLMCGQMTLSVARRFLPRMWAFVPAGLYAFAPGPWYKVFFVWSVLLIAVAALRWLDRPTLRGASLFGLAVGIAAGCRIEAGVIGLVLAAGMSALMIVDRLRSPVPPNRPNEILSLLVTFVGAALALGAWVPVYAAAGKLHDAVAFFRNDVFAPLNRNIVVQQGGMTLFDPASLLIHPSLEQAFYAGGALAALVVALVALPRLFSAGTAERRDAIFELTLAALALGSMTYTFTYVWNSRMLSTFPIVYVAYCVALGHLVRRVSVADAKRLAGALSILGLTALAASIVRFAMTVDFYSGSIVTRFRQTVEVAHPRLRGIHVYVGQVGDILGLGKQLSAAPAGATLISMSEATTMGFLSGLPNPTRYRVFVREFAVPGEDERAVVIIDRFKIDFLVARRSQFLAGGGFSSNLAAYAPNLRQYLVSRYDVVPLGNNFVLLRRRA